jgi:lipopolysaccharide export system permease protein
MYFYTRIVFPKKLYSLTIKSFLPPFTATLFISVFLLFLVQIVITYLDDFIGKGLKTVDLLSLFTYAWIAIIPQCIPLAVLLASIMSFGNMAENYELTAMKSSGISLFRIMKADFILVLLLSGLTFLFNNFILPVVHLKSTALLYDIRQKKPAVNIKEGIFYNGINNYSIRVGRKSGNKDVLNDIYIYDHSAHMGNNVQMYSKSGKITTTADTSALVLILRDGNRYEETAERNNGEAKKTLSQLNYKQLQVNIPLEDFKMKRTNEELFKNHGQMLNIWQIDSVVDSTKRVANRKLVNITAQALNSFYSRISNSLMRKDTLKKVSIKLFYDSLKTDQFNSAIQNALNITRTSAGIIEAHASTFENDNNQLKEYMMEWHKKVVVCFACIVLFFIGAPLGAIIKKGGFGLPVIVSVLFFLAFYILTEMFNSFALDGYMPPWQALWMPPLIFLPISVFLTYKAAHDSMIFDVSSYYTWVGKILKKNQDV